MNKHVTRYLLEAAAEQPDKVALELPDVEVGYGELAYEARLVADGLRSFELCDGAAIGIMLPNVPEFVEALYGAWLASDVVVPMNVLLTAAEIRYLVQDSRLAALIVVDRFLPQVEAAIHGLPNPPRVFVVGQPGSHTPYERLVEVPPTRGALPELATDAHV